jgi:hypothetical protein
MPRTRILPISIPVQSVTSAATGCLFLAPLIILDRLGLVGGYLAKHRNRKVLKEVKQQLAPENDRQNGVAGGCGSIWAVASARNTTPPTTG